MARLLTLSEAVQVTGRTYWQLQGALRRGTLRGRKLGPIWVVSSSDLDQYLAGEGPPSGAAAGVDEEWEDASSTPALEELEPRQPVRRPLAPPAPPRSAPDLSRHLTSIK